MKTILTNCTVIDCTGRPPMKETTVIIEDDKIVELKPGMYQEPAGEGERVFDLEGSYVLPGLWNVHTHLGELFPDPKHILSSESAIDRAIRAGRNAMDALRAGITGIRVVGERDFIDLYWKEAFDDGAFIGPRLFVCGNAISATSWPTAAPIRTINAAEHDQAAVTVHHPGICMIADPSRALGSQIGYAVGIDGPSQMRKAVRANIYDVDQISLIINGLLLDEVQAATEVAHQRSSPPIYPRGKRVGAEAMGAEVKMAIQGGVDCIRHGGSLDDEAIEMMLGHDVFYVPTLVCTQDAGFLSESGLDEIDLSDANYALAGRRMIAQTNGAYRERAQAHLEGFEKALKAGVKIACGGEFNPIREFTRVEIEHLVRAGMTEMEALIAATRTSADLCSVVDKLGTVEVGKLADLIVVSGNPLEDISNLRNLNLVLKGGKLVETREPEGLADFWELFYFE